MYLRYVFIVYFFSASLVFAAEQNPLELNLKYAEHLLAQTAKQSKDRELKSRVKKVKEQLEGIRNGIRDGSITNVIPYLVHVQKLLRNDPQHQKFQHIRLHLSKLLGWQGAFSVAKRKEFGLQIVEFTVPEGLIYFYLPDDLIETEPFTYSVRMLSYGVTDADRVENGKSLAIYALEFASSPVQLTSQFQQIAIVSAPPAAEVTLKTAEGFLASRATISISHAPTRNIPNQDTLSTDLEIDTNQPRDPVMDVDISHLLYQLPAVNQAGRLLEIRGPFDGTGANTVLRINGADAVVVAESNRKTVAINPRVAGTMQFNLSENGRKVRCRYKNLDLRSWSSVETLARGARAVFTVQLNSAEKLPTPVTIILENKTPQIISLQDGWYQYVVVEPKSIEESGNFNISRVLTGMHPAFFRIDARIDTTYLFSACTPP